MSSIQTNSVSNIVAASGLGQTQIFTGACTLESITVNLTSAWTIGIIDGTSGSTPNVGLLKASIAEKTYTYNCRLANGLRIAYSGHGGDITVTYRS